MITRLADAQQIRAQWPRLLAQGWRDPQTLLRALQLDPDLLHGTQAAAARFPLWVPEPFVARIQLGDPADPLLRQVLPQALELDPGPVGYETDPTGDQAATPCAGVVQKYQGRALLLATGRCAMHCRYCFRRYYPYPPSLVEPEQQRRVLDYLQQHEAIEEVILSGGDPLVLPDHHLARFVKRLERIRHLQRLRIHTRVPVVLPQRVDAALLAWLGAGRLERMMVLHINHAREMDAPVATALADLHAVGVRLYNQSVLLRGVNDRADVLMNLSKTLFAHRVEPYYLHLLDRVRGSAHFEVSVDEARSLLDILARELPGYLVPRLVKDIQGQSSKTMICRTHFV
ncbi:EF-P beta-lysylation protein EpmB [Thiorhodospira sibirica]|uniref:EF-P beta-lysylation protein EpmB n=1 Tax=Thiorhodospira sibirica TaxID=154347 RepID=UPI00022C52B3|nr:EF-P beta-lysylation protein EpmB [Thiorhodospira sibirica]